MCAVSVSACCARIRPTVLCADQTSADLGLFDPDLQDSLAEVNEEKTRIVDLTRGESFGFLGFEFRRVRSRAGRWMSLRRPQGKKRTALLRRLKEVFKRSRSRPLVVHLSGYGELRASSRMDH